MCQAIIGKEVTISVPEIIRVGFKPIIISTDVRAKVIKINNDGTVNLEVTEIRYADTSSKIKIGETIRNFSLDDTED